MNLLDDLLERVGRPRSFHRARQVDRDARDGAVQLVDDRPPRPAIEGHPVQQDDGRAGSLDVMGGAGLPDSRRP
ncbi:hypothetical protein HBB16_21185 [Pseudonocardia sp. MCCB 268]|nr:hypothetical protein [Pseudonocardia cytotoxica]